MIVCIVSRKVTSRNFIELQSLSLVQCYESLIKVY
jgi:hypothetical protein